MKRWMWFETLFRSLKDELRDFLQENNIQYELSGCGVGWHFEVLCSEDEQRLIDEFLDLNTIREVRA